MRLSELMAAVRMTPIKEREEEDGLGEAEVAVDCCGEDNSARKRIVEQQEDEIRQYEAMLRAEAEDDERRREADTEAASGSAGDRFHGASELEFELTELQQLSLEDDRRSSLFAALPLAPTTEEWADGDQDECAVEDEQEAVAPGESVPPALELPVCTEDASVDDSDIELQRPRKLAEHADQQAEPPLTAPPCATIFDITTQSDILPEPVDDSAVEQNQPSEPASETALCDTYTQLDSVADKDVESLAAAENSGLVSDVRESTIVSESVLAYQVEAYSARDECPHSKSADSPSSVRTAAPLSPPRPPSPVSESSPPSCPTCFSVVSSLLQCQASCNELRGQVAQLTADREALHSEREEQRSQLQRVLDEQAEKKRETDAKLQKEDEDYKSLYFAYCQLERQYNTLRSEQQLTPVQSDDDDDDVDEEDEDSGLAVDQVDDDVDVDESIDYAAMSEEKVLPRGSPEPEDPLFDGIEKMYVAHHTMVAQKDDRIRALNERVLTLESDNQRLAGDLDTRHLQLEDVQAQLRTLDGEKQQLVADCNSAQTAVQQLQTQLSEQRDTVEYAQNEKLALEQELSTLHTAHSTLLDQQTTQRQQYESLLAQQQQKDADMLSVIDDSIANIEQLRTQLANGRLAFDRCQQTLLEQWDEHLVRDEELYAVRLELQQTSVELGVEAERVLAMAAQLTQADGMRAALESRLRCSEDRVEELTALMATVEHDRRKDQHTHSTLATQLSEADRQLDEQKQKQRELVKQLRHAEDRAVRLDGDITMHEQKYVRLQSELQRERDERRREVERRRETEAQLDQLQQHTATLEGQQEALTQSIQLRPLGVTDEYERRLRDKEALILRLGKTVKQMHRHIEVDVAQREAEMARTIRQMQRVFVLVVRILSKPQYSTDSDVRRLLEVLDRESAAAKAVEAKSIDAADDRAPHQNVVK